MLKDIVRILAHIALASVAGLSANSYAQTFDKSHASAVILPGNGTDLTNTLTLQAPSLGGPITWTLPSSNGSNGAALTTNGSGTLSWSTPMANPMTTLGDMIYASVTGSPATPARLAGNTTTKKQFLTSTGTGSAATAPAWGTIAVNDVPTLNQNTTGTASNVTGIVALANGGTGVTNASGIGANTFFAGPSSGSSGAASFRTMTGNDLAAASDSNGAVAVLGRNTNDISTSSASLVNATGYSLSIAANSVWAFEFDVEVNGNGSGMNFAITVPSGATVNASGMGIYSSLSDFKCDRLTASGQTTDAGKPYGKTGLDGPVRITGVVVNGSSAGTIQLQYESASSGTSVTIYKNSYGIAHRF